MKLPLNIWHVIIENEMGHAILFYFFGHYNVKSCVSNVHYMANKMVTNGYKGKSRYRMSILMSFMPIRILMGAITRALCFN